ncbi:MAG: UpxY family transcription antiterminator [Melioribacteraceae bacterium]
MFSETIEKKWVAFYTKPRQEFKAAQKFQSLNIECYLPTIITLRRWSDRKKKIQVPLFNGYVFAKVNEKERLIAVQQDAVVKVVSFNGKPSYIPEWQIDSIKKMLSETPDVFVTNGLEVGQHVKIAEGPFAGVDGCIKEMNKEKWLCVSIELLNRTVSVKLSLDSVIKIIQN